LSSRPSWFDSSEDGLSPAGSALGHQAEICDLRTHMACQLVQRYPWPYLLAEYLLRARLEPSLARARSAVRRRRFRQTWCRWCSALGPAADGGQPCASAGAVRGMVHGRLTSFG